MKYLDLLKKKIDCLLESVYDEIAISIILIYIGIVERTSVVTFESDPGDCILLFWHEDIYSMILLRKFFKRNVSVVVADTNKLYYWIKLLHRLKIEVIVSNSPFWIKKGFKCGNHKIILAIDGPFGPRKVPNKSLVNALLRFKVNWSFVNCHISKKVEIGKDWNEIILPVPFTKINFEFKKYSEQQLHM